MAHVNARPETYGLKLVYSSPAAYFAAIKGHEQRERSAPRAGKQARAAASAFDGDFFPPTFSAHYVRAGFFSSRPASKALDRAVWARGDVAKRLRVLHFESPTAVANLDAAVAAVDASVGVHQHHDAMSGTDLVAVADNYRQMMIVADELAVPASAAAAATLSGTAAAAAALFTGCVQSNVSVCAGTTPLQQGKALTLVLFNPLGSTRSDVISIPVPVAGISVSGASGEVASEVHEAIFVDRTQPHAHNFTLFVNVSLAPLGLLNLRLTPLETKNAELVRWMVAPSVVALSAPGGATATVDGATGALSSVAGRPVASSLEYYVPNAGSNTSHGYSQGGACSSAYAFLPMPGGTTPFNNGGAVVRVARGKLVQQTHAAIDPKAGVELAVRVVAGDASVRLLAKLGPLDTSNGVGQEAVIILDCCKSQADVCPFGHSWVTDANALQMIERTWRDNSTSPKTAMGTPYVVWEPEAQNYYPATAMAALHGSSGGLTVAFNAAHGVTSRSAGALELMLHRRIVDHGCRTDEGYQMDDVHPVVSELRLRTPNDQAKAAAAYRADALNLLHPLSTFFGPARAPVADRRRRTAVHSLPANVHLHTLRTLGTDLAESHRRCDPFMSLQSCAAAIAMSRTAATRDQPLELLVRFQHLFAAGEDTMLSLPAMIDMSSFLASVLPGFKIVDVVETTLVAAKVIDAAPEMVFSLRALQIRTFVVTGATAGGGDDGPATSL